MFSLLFFYSFHRKSESYSTSSGSKSHSRSRSRSDSPPRQFNHTSSYKGSKVRSYKKSKDYKYSTHKPQKSRSRSSSRSRSRSRERSDHSGKYKKKSHYYRNHRHERSRSYERASHRYDRDHPGHSRHRRWIKQRVLSFGIFSFGLLQYRVNLACKPPSLNSVHSAGNSVPYCHESKGKRLEQDGMM